MNYSQTLEFLFTSMPSFQQVGSDAYKPGLERITEFCRHLGNPQRNYFTIHVAGTNGKGSVAHMLASILSQAGYRTGLYTSPHLVDFRERISVDNEFIPKQKVVNFVDKHQAKMQELDLSFFEMTTALAFDYFAQSDVEVAVIETGLGGRLDATNVIMPILSIVTNVGMEHTALLGDTIEKIASEKAGIAKKSIPLLLGESDERYNEVFRQAAAEARSPLVYAEELFRCNDVECFDEDSRHFSMERLRDGHLYELDLDLMGDYQRRNIVTVCAAADMLHEETPLTISRRAFREGLATAAANTQFYGRWQITSREPLTICDTGHNAHGLRYVAEQLESLPCRELYCVVGFAKDKDLAAVMPILPRRAHYIFTQASVDRARKVEDVVAEARRAGLDCTAVATVAEAVAAARERMGAEDALFVGGSTFVVADFLVAEKVL